MRELGWVSPQTRAFLAAPGLHLTNVDAVWSVNAFAFQKKPSVRHACYSIAKPVEGTTLEEKFGYLVSPLVPGAARVRRPRGVEGRGSLQQESARVRGRNRRQGE
jgi:hypothetical protein